MDALTLTRDLLRFETINPPGEEEACARHLGRLLEAAGFEVREHAFGPRRTSLVARIGRGDAPPLAFTGHIDTVPLGATPWTRDATGELAGGKLYGRGASDMKSGVAAFVTAALALAPRLGATPGLVLVITAGEETMCEGARHLVATGAVPRAGALVVAEPTGNVPFFGHKGALWLTARTSGVTAHGSMPERGVNAVYKAARAVLMLEKYEFGVAPHPVLGRPTLNVGHIHGGLNINSVPDGAAIGIDIRTVPGQKHAALRAHLAAHLGGDVALGEIGGAEGVWTDPEHPFARDVAEIAEGVAGVPRAVQTAPYFTDASFLTPGMGDPPTVVLGPGEVALCHQTDEYCLVDRLHQSVALFTEITKRWCRL